MIHLFLAAFVAVVSYPQEAFKPVDSYDPHPLFLLHGSFYTCFPIGEKPKAVATEKAHWWWHMGDHDGLSVYQSIPCI